MDTGLQAVVSGFRIPCQWNLDSRFQSLAGFRIPWVEFWIPKLRNPDSTNSAWISIPQTDYLIYLGRPNRLDISPSKYRPWTTFGIENISNRRVICNYIYKNFNWCHLPNCKNSNQKEISDYNKTDMCFKNIVSASDSQSNPALRTPGQPRIITDSLHCVWGKKALTLSLIKFNPRTLSLIKITGFPYL